MPVVSGANGSTAQFVIPPVKLTAADIVDEDMYAMIDNTVADTPHAGLDFDAMGGDVIMTIITRDVSARP